MRKHIDTSVRTMDKQKGTLHVEEIAPSLSTITSTKAYRKGVKKARVEFRLARMAQLHCELTRKIGQRIKVDF